MMHAAGDAPGTMRPPVLAAKGTTYFRALLSGKTNAISWGNYSSTCIDPTDPGLIWTCQEYARSDLEGQWCTAWAAFRLR
jgi:hypothetical protein